MGAAEPESNANPEGEYAKLEQKTVEVVPPAKIREIDLSSPFATKMFPFVSMANPVGPSVPVEEQNVTGVVEPL